MGGEGRAGGAREEHAGGTKGERRVFRSPVAVGFGVVWSAFVVANLVDLALRGTGRDATVLAAALLLGTAVVYATCLRPRIVADEAGVTVHNPIRDIRASWRSIDRIDATDAVRLHTGERRYRCWAMQVSHRSRTRARLREQSRAARAGAHVPRADHQPHRDRSRADEVAAALEEMAGRFQGRASRDGPPEEPATPPAVSAPVVVTWSPSALAALGVTLVLVVASALVPFG